MTKFSSEMSDDTSMFSSLWSLRLQLCETKNLPFYFPKVKISVTHSLTGVSVTKANHQVNVK